MSFAEELRKVMPLKKNNIERFKLACQRQALAGLSTVLFKPFSEEDLRALDKYCAKEKMFFQLERIGVDYYVFAAW